MSFYLGIDFGTTGVRTSIIDKNKKVLINFSVSIDDPISKGSLVYQNPSLWWNALIKNLTYLKTKIELNKIERLSIDGTSGTILITDHSGNPLDNALMYNDASAVKESKLVESISDNHPIVSTSTNALVRALSLINKLKKEKYRILHQADWIACKIIDDYMYSDENNALKLGYDCIERSWPKWFDKLPIEINSLPNIKIPGQSIGELRNTELIDLGFSNKTKVIAGTTDSIAAFLATGAKNIGEAVSSIGTTLVVKAISNKPIYNKEFGIYSHRLGENWLAGGASNVGGKILKELFSDRIEELSKDIDPNNLLNLNYYPLAQKGERFPFNDPNKLPILEPRPNSEIKFFQAVLEGITNVEKLSYEKILEIGGKYPKTIFTIGGGGKNLKWNEIRKKILGVKLNKPLSNDASFGSALIALGNIF